MRTCASGSTSPCASRTTRAPACVSLALLLAIGMGSNPARAQESDTIQACGTFTGTITQTSGPVSPSFGGTFTFEIDANGSLTGTVNGGTFNLVGTANGNSVSLDTVEQLTVDEVHFTGSASDEEISGSWQSIFTTSPMIIRYNGSFEGTRTIVADHCVLDSAEVIVQAQAQTSVSNAESHRSILYRRMENRRTGGAELKGNIQGDFELEVGGIEFNRRMFTSGASGIFDLAAGLQRVFAGTTRPDHGFGRKTFMSTASQDQAWLPRTWTPPPASRDSSSSNADTTLLAQAPGDSPSATAIASSDSTDPWSGWGMFANGHASFGDRKNSDGAIGYDTTSGGFTLGADRQFGDALFGLGVGYTRDDTSFDGGGSSKSDAGYLVGFGSYYFLENGFIDGSLGAGAIAFKTVRQDLDGKARGSTEAPQIWGGLTGGYDFHRGAWTVSPYARLNVASTWVLGYTEHGADAPTENLEYDTANTWSLSTVLAVRVNRPVSMNWGVINPYVRVEYEHEFGDAPESKIERPDGTKLSLVGGMDRNFANVGGGSSVMLPGGWSGFVDYDGLFGNNDFKRHTITAGVRRDF